MRSTQILRLNLMPPITIQPGVGQCVCSFRNQGSWVFVPGFSWMWAVAREKPAFMRRDLRGGAFKRIVGFDFDASLIQSARSNLERFGQAPITFEHQDAARYLLPDTQAFVFMFNPFDDQVLRMFLKNNLDGFRKSGHIIGYSNDVHRSVIEELGFRKLYRDDQRKMSLWQLRAADT